MIHKDFVAKLRYARSGGGPSGRPDGPAGLRPSGRDVVELCV
jgi:hypothetical protein